METKVKAALQMIQAMAEAIRELGAVPEGHLYAMVMAQMDLDEFNWVMARLVDAGVITRKNHVLAWVHV